MFLHVMASDKNTMDKDCIPLNRHIQPENAVIDRIPIQVLPADGRTVFLMARVARDRIYSEQTSSLQTPSQRPRFFSRDFSGQSLFGFSEHERVESEAVACYKELYHWCLHQR